MHRDKTLATMTERRAMRVLPGFYAPPGWLLGRLVFSRLERRTAARSCNP